MVPGKAERASQRPNTVSGSRFALVLVAAPSRAKLSKLLEIPSYYLELIIHRRRKASASFFQQSWQNPQPWPRPHPLPRATPLQSTHPRLLPQPSPQRRRSRLSSRDRNCSLRRSRTRHRHIRRESRSRSRSHNHPVRSSQVTQVR